MSCADRLSALRLDSLETQRPHLELIYLYKIKVDLECSSMFVFAPLSTTRGHCYLVCVKRIAELTFVIKHSSSVGA